MGPLRNVNFPLLPFKSTQSRPWWPKTLIRPIAHCPVVGITVVGTTVVGIAVVGTAVVGTAAASQATACVEVWQTSNLRRLRLGEEKRRRKKEERRNHRMKI